MTFKVVLSQAAADDLERLYDFATQRELNSESGDLNVAERALLAIKNGLSYLKAAPFACRKVGDSPFVRELVIPFGNTGYVALFEIVDDATVIVGAVRHQREDDYH